MCQKDETERLQTCIDRLRGEKDYLDDVAFELGRIWALRYGNLVIFSRILKIRELSDPKPESESIFDCHFPAERLYEILCQPEEATVAEFDETEFYGKAFIPDRFLSGKSARKFAEGVFEIAYQVQQELGETDHRTESDVQDEGEGDGEDKFLGSMN